MGFLRILDFKHPGLSRKKHTNRQLSTEKFVLRSILMFWTSPKLLPPRWIGKLPNPNGPQSQTALFIQKFTVSERNKSYEKIEKKNYYKCWGFWIHQLSRGPCQPCLWWTLLRKLRCFKGGFQKKTRRHLKIPGRPTKFLTVLDSFMGWRLLRKIGSAQVMWRELRCWIF